MFKGFCQNSFLELSRFRKWDVSLKTFSCYEKQFIVNSQSFCCAIVPQRNWHALNHRNSRHILLKVCKIEKLRNDFCKQKWLLQFPILQLSQHENMMHESFADCWIELPTTSVLLLKLEIKIISVLFHKISIFYIINITYKLKFSLNIFKLCC